MAEKLSIQIALEGGKEIERQLEGIGDAGKKAFEDIAQSAEQVGGFKNLEPEEVTAKLKDAGLVGTEAFDKIKTAVANASRMESVVIGIQSVENAFGKVVQTASSVVGAFKGAAIIGMLTQVVRSVLATADAITDVNTQAQKLGLTIEQFDQLRIGFEKAGISAKAIGDGIAHFKGELDKVNLEGLKTAFKELEEAAKRGFGAQGTAQLKLLENAAKGTGEAAKQARGYLEKLGLPISEEGKTALERLGVTATTTAEGLREAMVALQQMPDSAQRTALAFEILGNTMGPQFIAALQTGSFKIEEFFNKTNTLTQEQAVQAAKLQQAWNQLGAAWERFSSLTLSPVIIKGLKLLTTELQNVQKDIENTKQEFIDLGAAITGFWERLKAEGAASWQAVKDAVQGTLDVINRLIEAIGNVIEKLLKLLGLGSEVGNPGPGRGATGSFAGGGRVGGRGTGTSDSNLAWVSRGEHIMPARAVAQPGVLALLEALRRSGGDLRGVLGGMGRFAAGGVVPRFADGGLVGGMGHLGTVDLRTDHGAVRLMASSSAVEQLSRLAVTKRMTSTGKKPGFIG